MTGQEYDKLIALLREKADEEEYHARDGAVSFSRMGEVLSKINILRMAADYLEEDSG
jgi:hypothetical protein